jgi:hypothetical protein
MYYRGLCMILDKKNEFALSIKVGQSEVTIPRGIFLGVIGGIFLLCLLKIARTL